MNTSDLVELGREVNESYVPGMQRRLPDGTIRPLTNVEMAASLAARRVERMFERSMERWSERFIVWLSRGCVEPEEYFNG